MGAADEDAEPLAPAETVARADARASPLGEIARSSALAAHQPDEGGPGMTASPSPIHPADPETPAS
jgi:hypothetical protein